MKIYGLLLPFLGPTVALQVYRECRKEGSIAFTFDQGPSQYTGILLTSLSKANVKATFHIVPDYLENPVVSANLRRAATEGHLIGLFVKDNIKEENVKVYLNNACATMKQYINYQPTFLRFTTPGPSDKMLKIVTELGYKVTSYNLDSQDYSYANETTENNGEGNVYRTIRGVLDQIVPPTLGSFICVQRDIVQASVMQMPAILKYVKGRGYKAIRLDECIGNGITPSKDQDEDMDGNSITGQGEDSEKQKYKGQSKNLAYKIAPSYHLMMMTFHIMIILLL